MWKVGGNCEEDGVCGHESGRQIKYAFEQDDGCKNI